MYTCHALQNSSRTLADTRTEIWAKWSQFILVAQKTDGWWWCHPLLTRMVLVFCAQFSRYLTVGLPELLGFCVPKEARNAWLKFVHRQNAFLFCKVPWLQKDSEETYICMLYRPSMHTGVRLMHFRAVDREQCLYVVFKRKMASSFIRRRTHN